MSEACPGHVGYPEPYRCEECPFFGKIVGAKGPPDSPFVIIGESPGKNELREGLPFVGPSGIVLEAALSQHEKGSYPTPYITNAFKCFPYKQKEAAVLHKPTQACSKQLHDELRAYPRKVILALGNPAVWSTTGDYNLKITQVRGRLYESDLAPYIVAGVHPAFLLRGGGNFRQFKADVDYAIRLLKYGESARKRIPLTTYSLIDTDRDLEQFVQAFARSPHPYIVSDYETTGFSHIADRLICAGYTLDGRHAYIVPILDNPRTIKHLAVIHGLQNVGAKFVWHNGKFDIKFAHQARVTTACVDEDTMLMSYSQDETKGIHDLETVSSDLLGSPNWKNALKQFIPKGGTYADAPRHLLYDYLAKDLFNTHGAFFIFRQLMAADKISQFQYNRSLIPASKFLAEVEKRGIPVDTEMVKTNQVRLLDEIKRLGDIVIRQSEEAGFVPLRDKKGETKMLNSPKQLGELIYDCLGLKAPKSAKKKRSTEEKNLKELNHPIIDALRSYRKVHKGYSTYVKALGVWKGTVFIPRAVQPDGRVHQTYLIHGTATGRLSSRNPNVQNIPRDPLLRGQYRALPGRIFVEPDLNQAELRSLACLSGDEELCRIYSTEGMSLHEEVRRTIFGDPTKWSEEEVMKFLHQFFLPERYNEGKDRIVEEQKMAAKTVNFGIVYGRTAVTIAEAFKVSMAEAQRWIDAWFIRFPKAKAFIDQCRAAPMKMQNLRTPFGYRKRFGVISYEHLNEIQNEASNFPHQNIASMCNLHAAMQMDERLVGMGAYIINLVHDSILIDCPDNNNVIRVVVDIATKTMEDVPKQFGLTRIPFKADAKIGYRWGSMDDSAKFFKARQEAQAA